MEFKKILFIVRSFDKSAPQPIRFQKITSYLKKDFDIHILMLYHGDRYQYIEKNGLKLHKVPYSKIGKKINNEMNLQGVENTDKQNAKNKPFFSFFFKSLLVKMKIRSWFFPDTLIFEITNLKKALKKLLNSYDFDIVLGSSFPHTTLMLAKTAKATNKELKWVHDIGDPCYSPLNGYKFKALLSYLYETYYSKYVDKLIVTNNATKKYYISRYRHYTDKNVSVIQMGADIQTEKSNNVKFDLPLNMMYAGTFYDKLREPHEMYKAIAYFSETVKLNLFGNISSKHLPKKSIENINLRGSVKHSELIRIYNTSDIVLYIDNAYGLQTPGKVFEVISAVKPILCIYENENSASLTYFKNIPYAIICKNEKKEIVLALKQLLEKIKNNELTFNYDLTSFKWENRAKEFIHIFNEFNLY